MKDDQLTDNKIGDEGAKALNEILKKNSTLTLLDLSCERGKEKGRKRKE